MGICTILASCGSDGIDTKNDLVGRYGGDDCKWGAIELGDDGRAYIDTVYKISGTYDVDGDNIIVNGDGMPGVVFKKNGDTLGGGNLGSCEKLIDVSDLAGTIVVRFA